MYRLKILTQSGVHNIDAGTIAQSALVGSALVAILAGKVTDNKLNCGFRCQYYTHDSSWSHCKLFKTDLENGKRVPECIDAEAMFNQYGKLAE